MGTKKLKNVKSRKYLIYGIFNTNSNELFYVNMDMEQTELEFDISGYDPEIYSMVSFKVVLT